MVRVYSLRLGNHVLEMDRSKVSVYINPFSPSASQDDVLEFVLPFQPIDVRLRSKNNDSRGSQVAFVDFADEETALALIAEKNFSRFMGQSMRLRLAFANQNNNNCGSNLNRSFQENRSSPQSWNNQHRRGSPKERSRLREIQMTPREVVRGTFTIVASVSCTHFVALETGWQSDMDELDRGLEDFANFAKCGVDEMDPAVVYACIEPNTGKWRRCRKVAEEQDALVVELIDLGGSMMVTKDQVLFLSQLYKDWSIKAVDLFFDGYAAASGSSDNFKRVEEHVLNKTFQLAYLHERTGPLMRDCVRVQDMKLNGESVLDELVQKGLLLKRQPPQEKPPLSNNTTQRPITKSSGTPRASNPPSTPITMDRSPPRVQSHPDNVQPMNVDVMVPRAANTCREGDWGEWNQQSQGSPPQNHRNKQQPSDGWGSVGLARDDIGTEVWDRTDRIPTGGPTEGWSECGNETPLSHRTMSAWNTHDWSASPPKKAPADAAVQQQCPSASGKAGTAASAAAAAMIGNQSPAIQNAQIFKPKKCDDVFSDVDEWNKNSRRTPPKQEPSTPALERLAISEETPQQCPTFNEVSLKLQTMEKLVCGRAVQQMVSDRIALISAELNKLKMHITRLSIMSAQPEAAMSELRHHRRTAQLCTKDLEEIIQLASAETLDAYHLRAWAQFVGRIWSPMMNLLFFNEQPLCVYESTVIRRAEIDLNLSVEEDPLLTIVLERAIDPPKIFKFAQDLMTHKDLVRVHRVFFSEDNSKAFIILACPSVDESLDEYGRRAVDFLLGTGIFQ